MAYFFFFSSRRRHTRFDCDWSSDVCSSDLCCRRTRAGFPPAIPLESDVLARAPHRAYGVEGYERSSHGKLRCGRRPPGRHPPRGQQTFPVVPLCLQQNNRQECRSYLVAQPCDSTLPSVPKRTRYVKEGGRSRRVCTKRMSEISTTATSPSLWKRVTGNRENHRTFCTSGMCLAISINEFGGASG